MTTMETRKCNIFFFLKFHLNNRFTDFFLPFLKKCFCNFFLNFNILIYSLFYFLTMIFKFSPFLIFIKRNLVLTLNECFLLISIDFYSDFIFDIYNISVNYWTLLKICFLIKYFSKNVSNKRLLKLISFLNPELKIRTFLWSIINLDLDIQRGHFKIWGQLLDRFIWIYPSMVFMIIQEEKS